MQLEDWGCCIILYAIVGIVRRLFHVILSY